MGRSTRPALLNNRFSIIDISLNFRDSATRCCSLARPALVRLYSVLSSNDDFATLIIFSGYNGLTVPQMRQAHLAYASWCTRRCAPQSKQFFATCACLSFTSIVIFIYLRLMLLMSK